jgi:hypothetical protein
MADHKFSIGEVVDFVNARVALAATTETCEILRQLSTDGDDPQYRVKCSEEGFERVVRESQLKKPVYAD